MKLKQVKLFIHPKLIILALTFMASHADAVTPDMPTYPGQLFKGDTNFAYLINHFSEGKPEHTPWAGYWWPYTRNGIASDEFKSKQSPAGKYDAARGGSTHAQNWEANHHGATLNQIQSWWGHDTGWSTAAILFSEPKDPVTVNGITFGVADIKALLSELGMEAEGDHYGNRVDVDDPANPDYWDVIPNQYFLVLTHEMGKLKKGIVVDRYTGAQTWLQPVAGYRFDYPSPNDYLGKDPKNPRLYRIQLTGTLWWVNDGVEPDIQTPQFTFQEDDPDGIFESRTLKMELWLDGPVKFDSKGKVTSSGNVVQIHKDGRIVGGEWKMGDGYLVDAWPDTMFVPKVISPSTGFKNPEIDAQWIKDHILVSGGRDDTSVRPVPVAPAPPVPLPSNPFPVPSPEMRVINSN